MDLNEFLIHSSALNIQLPRNLITQFRGNRFREYINDNELQLKLSKAGTYETEVFVRFREVSTLERFELKSFQI